MKKLKKWFNALKWLFNDAPTGMTKSDEIIQCDFCDRESPDPEVGITQYCDADFCICHACLKKAFNAVLKFKWPTDE